MRSRERLSVVLILVALSACTPAHEVVEEEEDASWAVTAWGEKFEIFAETDPLEVGTTSVAFTHVTLLEDFSAVEQGTVTVVLRDASSSETLFTRDEATRAGIFSVPVAPQVSGEFELSFRIETAEASEEIFAGRVLVGESGAAGGGLLESEARASGAESAGAGAPISFLKEQQWRTPFSTTWLEMGQMSESLGGPGLVRAAAGGEILLTSAFDGMVSGTPWPYAGSEVRAGDAVFRVVPRVAADRSLVGLESDVATLEADLAAGQARRERLEGLLELGAASQRDFEEADLRVVTLESRLVAARGDLASAGAGRRGNSGLTTSLGVYAPFSGRVARIDVTPGQVVAAGTPLGLFVRERPLWVAVSLRPDVAGVLGEPDGLVLSLGSQRKPLIFGSDEVRLVSISPIVDAATGTVTALLEIEASVRDLPIGMRLEAEVLLSEERAGVVVPTTALIDDGGVAVVYLQTEGESFARAEVRVVVRQGERALVEGLPPGARVVTLGGNAVRRATLVAQDVGEGHVH
jgi:cobalt-zinc-cadmium efflux system membrane fusion protein